jgi:predicted alpha/beta-hydrolase family hydrolase
MEHSFMEEMAEALAAREVATLRFQFPYMEQGRKAPDRAPACMATVRAAVDLARSEVPDLPVVAGGKSMGGRMTSLAASERELPGVGGLVFLGFPLHAPKKPGTSRGDHLFDVGVPMLFLQGSRDRLAEQELLGPIVKKLPAATMYVVEEGDHSFKVPKRTGKTHGDVIEDLAEQVQAWARTLPGMRT